MTEEAKTPESVNTDTNAESLKAEAIKYRQARNEARIEAAVLKECIKHGVSDYDAAVKLLPTEGLELEDGKVKGLDKAFTKLLTDRPFLKNEKSVNKDEGNDSTPELKSILKQASAKPESSGTEKYTVEDVKGMTSDQINANWDKISKQLEANNL